MCFYENAPSVGFHYVVHELCACVTASLSGMNRRQKAAPTVSHKGLYGNCITSSTPPSIINEVLTPPTQSLPFHIPALLSQRCLRMYFSVLLKKAKKRGWEPAKSAFRVKECILSKYSVLSVDADNDLQQRTTLPVV